MSCNKIAITAITWLAMSGTGATQTSDPSTQVASVVSFAGAIKYAVTKASPFALGYYYSVSNADQIEFHECGKTGSPRVLAKSDIEDTAEDCTSLPGTPTIPLITEIKTWKAQADGSFIVTSYPAIDGVNVSTHVRCVDVPRAALLAAAKQADSDVGIAVDEHFDVDKLKAALGMAKEAIVAAGSQSDLCGQIKSFWTIPLKSVAVGDRAVAVYGLSVADPSNLAQVNALERSLEKRE